MYMLFKEVRVTLRSNGVHVITCYKHCTVRLLKLTVCVIDQPLLDITQYITIDQTTPAVDSKQKTSDSNVPNHMPK